MKRSITLLIALLLGVTVLGACGNDNKDTNATATTNANASVKVTIGAQAFGESKILAEIYKQGLAKHGFATSVRTVAGNRATELTAFGDSTINFAPEYAASMLEFLNQKKGEATGDADATTTKLKPYLAAKGLDALKPSSAVDTNAFVITQATSDRLGLKTLSDLASKGKNLKLGAPSDCATNPFCIPGLKTTYGLDLSKTFTSLEPEQIADALDAGTIDIALLFSSGGNIAVKHYVLLEDDKHLLAADNVVPVLSKSLAANSQIVKYANAISDKLTTDKLIAMNKRFDVDKEDAAVIAKGFLTDEGLI